MITMLPVLRYIEQWASDLVNKGDLIKMYKSKIHILMLMFVIGTMLFAGCAKGDKQETLTTGESKVGVFSVRAGKIEGVVQLTGDIHGQKEASVYAKVSGKLIKKLKETGDTVKANEVMALIDREEEALDFARAQVKSPIDGIVTVYFVGLGGAVFQAQSMHGEPVAMVADMDKVKVVVYLGETEMAKVKKGQPARVSVDSYKDRIFKGVVTKVAPAADPMTRKLKAEITVDNPGHLLKPGTFARVSIITSVYKDILIVPKEAVLERGGEKIVFTILHNKAQMIKILTGVEDEKNTEIKEGLRPGDRVIIKGNYGLIEGTEVRVE